MALNYHYITNFEKSRQSRIGASDIPYLIPHPIRQIESLAAYTKDGKRYANTANDLYMQKVYGREYEYSFPAEMGHFIEGKALYEFIADFVEKRIASEFYRGYMLHKIDQDYKKQAIDPRLYHTTHSIFKHNTEATSEWGGVAHADCVYDPRDKNKSSLPGAISRNGITLDLDTPSLIEAKSSNYWSARRKDDPYTGYDLELKEWQGIPLKVYFQVQYQMLLYGVDTCYIVLIFDTNSKHYWTVKANKKHQAELQQLAMYMIQCIDTQTPPKNLLMNSKDICSLYPEVKEDFREAKGDELAEVLKLAIEQKEAAEQEKIWKRKKDECSERIAIHLKDTQVLKGEVGGIITDIAKWKETGGSLRVAGLKEIREREDGKTIEKYLKRKCLIKETEKSRKPNFILKKRELEDIKNDKML
jgi:hypothetical protein